MDTQWSRVRVYTGSAKECTDLTESCVIQWVSVHVRSVSVSVGVGVHISVGVNVRNICVGSGVGVRISVGVSSSSQTILD